MVPSEPGQASPALLPYGVVMATGAASQLAGLCGLRSAVAPLLWLAIAEAGWIAIRGAARRGGLAGAGRPTPVPGAAPDAQAGLLTVPLGLAVITTGLAGQRGGLSSPAAAAGLTLAWATAVIFVTRFLVRVGATRTGVATLDGSWFLAPAALLGVSISTGACLPLVPAVDRSPLGWLAAAAAAAGIAGYWAVMAVAAIRVARRRLDGARPVLWWICAGCGGLAAAAAARALALPGAVPAALAGPLRVAMVGTWATAAAVAVPVVLRSIGFLRRRPALRSAPWPPTFSSAVFALGTIGAGVVLRLPSLAATGRAAGLATLGLWAVTAAWNVAAASRARAG